MSTLNDFEKLLSNYEPLIKKWITKYRLFYDFDEYFQIARIALWEASMRFNPDKGPFPAYAACVIRGRLLTEMRQRKKYKERFTLTESVPESKRVEDDLLLEWVDQWHFLSPREKQWVQAAILEDKPSVDIAKRYGVTQDTVRSWKKSAVKKLRRYYNELREEG